MARRKKDRNDWIWAVGQLVALLLGLGFVFPPFRRMVTGFGTMFLLLLVLAITLLVGIGIYRLLSRHRTPPRILAFKVSARGSQVSETFGSTLAPPVLEIQTTAQLIDQIRSIDWFQFEQLVALVYRKLGYAVSRRGGANPDGGIDLIIEKDGTREAIQCKHWKTWKLGVKPVREFLGALTDAGIDRGIFITLGGYTGDAKRLANKHGIAIVNETDLARLLETTEARLDPAVVELLRNTRKLCPKCEKPTWNCCQNSYPN